MLFTLADVSFCFLALTGLTGSVSVLLFVMCSVLLLLYAKEVRVSLD